jgi:formylmethanofuran dehydrogenase subunit E
MPDSVKALADFSNTFSLEKLLGKPGRKVICDQCGEEIINERESRQEDRTLCRACTGDGYWRGLKHW